MNKIPAYQQKACLAMIRGLRQRKENIGIISPVNDSEWSVWCNFALQNAPEALDVEMLEFHRLVSMIHVMPHYRMKKSMAQERFSQCIRRREWIIKNCRRPDQYQTVLEIHNMLARNVVYQDCGETAHTMYGPLAEKRGVCDGYAKAFQFVLDGLGIPSFVVAGKAMNPVRGIFEPHAWNLVYIDGTWTHIDLTFDSTVSCFSNVRHDYFGLTEHAIKKDHVYQSELYPKAEDPRMEYYQRYGLAFSRTKQFFQYMEELLACGQRIGSFRVVSQRKNEEVTKRVSELATTYLASHGKSTMFELSYNLERSVYTIKF